jgi:hypothetical protein
MKLEAKEKERVSRRALKIRRKNISPQKRQNLKNNSAPCLAHHPTPQQIILSYTGLNTKKIIHRTEYKREQIIHGTEYKREHRPSHLHHPAC